MKTFDSSRRLSKWPRSARRGAQCQDRPIVAAGVFVGTLNGRRHQIDLEFAPADSQFIEREL